MIIDAYAHYWTPKYMKAMREYPNASVRSSAEEMFSIWKDHPNQIDVDLRIRELARYGIEAQVGAIHNVTDPNLLPLKRHDRIRFCRLQNDEAAELMTKTKGRLIPSGTVPLESFGDDGIEEMRRAKHDLGLKGFTVPTPVQGKPPDEFKDFWKEAERLGSVVHIHPTNAFDASCRKYESEFDLMHTFGWPYETTLAAARLVFSGIMAQCPNLKIICHHLGGMLPFFMGRIHETYEGKGKAGMKDLKKIDSSAFNKSLAKYFRMFYYDTAVGGSVESVKLGLEVFGSSRLVFGTDYPWGPDHGRKRLATYPDIVRKAADSTQDERKIFETNISNLLGL